MSTPSQSCTSRGVRQTIRSGGLWGIESDSTPPYFADIGEEQLEELVEILLELGFTRDAIDAARPTTTEPEMV